MIDRKGLIPLCSWMAVGLLALPSVADDVVIEVPRFEAGVQVSSGSIPNCCSTHSMNSINDSSLAMKGCTTMGGYCMSSRNAPFLTFDLSWIPEDAVVESVRLTGSRIQPRSASGTVQTAFLSWGEVGSTMFNVFTEHTAINWTAAPTFSINLDPDEFNDPARERFLVVRLTMSGEYASYVRNTRNFAPELRVTLATPPCVADLNDNGEVNAADLGFLVAAWGQTGHQADLDGSGLVDSSDLGILLSLWGPCPGP